MRQGTPFGEGRRPLIACARRIPTRRADPPIRARETVERLIQSALRRAGAQAVDQAPRGVRPIRVAARRASLAAAASLSSVGVRFLFLALAPHAFQFRERLDEACERARARLDAFGRMFGERRFGAGEFLLDGVFEPRDQPARVVRFLRGGGGASVAFLRGAQAEARSGQSLVDAICVELRLRHAEQFQNFADRRDARVIEKLRLRDFFAQGGTDLAASAGLRKGWRPLVRFHN